MTHPRAIPLGFFVVAAFAPIARGQEFDYSLQGGSSDLGFGSSISRIGDYDGDGAEDFIVGATYGAARLGTATVYSGQSGAQIVQLTGLYDSRFGAAVEGRIDIDGDGWSDVLVGAPYDATNGVDAGRLLVYSIHLGTTLFDLHGAAGANLGTSVRSIQEDLDGDGIDEFIVGAPGIATAYVYSGKSCTPLYTKTGQAGSHFGYAVSGGGRISNDKVGDFLVGTPDFVDSSGHVTGRVAAFSGKDGSKIWAIDGAPASYFGVSIAHPGDLDGDGFAECVVGAIYDQDPHGVMTGSVTVINGFWAIELFKVYGEQSGDLFGYSVRGANGDIDDDGVHDFVVGAPQLRGSSVGYARSISGADGSTLFTYLAHTSDPTALSQYGCAVAGGDITGDGRSDVLIGGNNFDTGRGIVEAWKTPVASYSTYGSGWPGTLGVPSLLPESSPVVGKLLTVDLSNSAGVTTPGFLLLGLDDATLATGKGGTILVDPFLVIPLSVPVAGLPMLGQIPDDPTLYGFDLYLQAIEADAGASKNLSFTAGLHLYFGWE